MCSCRVREQQLVQQEFSKVREGCVEGCGGGVWIRVWGGRQEHCAAAGVRCSSWVQWEFAKVWRVVWGFVTAGAAAALPLQVLGSVVWVGNINPL